MADTVSDGTVKVSFVPTISSLTGPTVAELGAGVALEGYITPDGLNLTASTESVDTSALNSTFTTAAPGRTSIDSSLTLKSQGYAGAPYTTFAANAAGYLVVRRMVTASTAWTAGQKVEVYSVKAGTRAKQPVAANEVERFQVKLHHTAAPTWAATVAA